ncbi:MULTISPECIES: hypothetical protein [Microbulbifer]|uniref:Ig-like domain-containing protein n=1 Tax=Microbulbifer celer TaxID=435905 RepID=A0ABW3U6D3_9GAMM|nr:MULTISPECIES: hypothetical protein [Microbulbifer]UFN58257.1 hypothetical protein LPW13_04215 [Microbulbifer celer]
MKIFNTIRNACLFALVAWSVAAGALLGLSLVAVPAQAQSVDTITCTGSSNTTYDPPITNQPATVTFSDDSVYAPCESTVPGITAGSGSFSSPVAGRSCLSLLEMYPVTVFIDWNNGQSSTLQLNAVTNIGAGVYTVTQTGTVTDGLFLGRSAVRQLVAPSIDILACTLGLGSVSSIGFTGVLAIL